MEDILFFGCKPFRFEDFNYDDGSLPDKTSVGVYESFPNLSLQIFWPFCRPKLNVVKGLSLRPTK